MMNPHGPGHQMNHGPGPGSGPGPGPAPPGWGRPAGAVPPPRGPTGTPGPRGPLKSKEGARLRNEASMPQLPRPGGSVRSAPEPMPQRDEFPMPPGYSGPNGPMGPAPAGMRPMVQPPLPPGTPGLDAARIAPPLRTRNGTPAPNMAPKPRKHDPLPPPPRGMTPTLRGPPPTAPPSNRAPSPPRAPAKRFPEQLRPQQSAPDLDFGFNFPTAPKGSPSEPAPPKFTCPRPAPPSPAPGAARPAHFDNPNWPLPATSPPPNKALPPPPHGHSGHRGYGGDGGTEWPGPRRNPMTPASHAEWPMVR